MSRKVTTMILQPIDSPTLGIMVEDIDFFEKERMFYIRCKYFPLDDFSKITDNADSFMLYHNDFVNSFLLCENWSTIQTMGEAKWASLKEMPPYNML